MSSDCTKPVKQYQTKSAKWVSWTEEFNGTIVLQCVVICLFHGLCKIALQDCKIFINIIYQNEYNQICMSVLLEWVYYMWLFDNYLLIKWWFILNLLYSTILMKEQSFIIGVLVIKLMYFSYLFKNYFS